jgi:ATP-dependent Clp protease ATP-binding subunit ClpB
MNTVNLDPRQEGDEIKRIRESMEGVVVGQRDAINAILETYQHHQAGLSTPGRPVGNFLFLGPTGTGKTFTVEAFARALYGKPEAVLKIDCAEFQHSHEIAKLIGSPPGYLGHRETSALLSQERVNQYFQPDGVKIGLVLFDEVEKASDALWNLLLGILDKGILTLGDNRRVDFSQSMIFMTGNVGARGISDILAPAMGLAPAQPVDAKRMDGASTEAARRKFSPEFFNRLENIVTFSPLTPAQVYDITNRELDNVVLRIKGVRVGFDFTPGAIEFVRDKGFDLRYGARHLLRAVKTYVSKPISALMASGQLHDGMFIVVEPAGDGTGLVFKHQLGEGRLAA